MRSLIFIFLIGSFCHVTHGQKLRKIFNNKDLDGWIVPNPNYDNWSVKDKMLLVKSSDDRKGSILWTQKTYKNFIVEVEYKDVSGIVDSGIFLRGENDQIQIGISGSLKRDLTASPYIPGKRYPVEAKTEGILKVGDWNTLKVKVLGQTYTVWLNGIEVMTYTSENIPNTGPIGIQLHPGNDMSIQYRKIRLAEI
ncbi:MAG: DUF1080 domain-containing protein [Cytophagaceae bacterium]|nr:DUF1080 domain-containing protein [Cytophagaceae bacterium]